MQAARAFFQEVTDATKAYKTERATIMARRRYVAFPAVACAVVAHLQWMQYREQDAEMERLGGVLAAELAAVENQRERLLVLAPQLAASAGATPAACARLSRELAALDVSPLQVQVLEDEVEDEERPEVAAAKVAIW